VDRRRLASALDAVHAEDDPSTGFDHLAVAAVDGMGLGGMSASAMRGTTSQIPVFGSDPTARSLEDLQFAVGEGPCVDAYTSIAPVLVADLGGHGAWPAFTPPAVDIGVAAVFAYPLHVAGVCIGALDLYADRPRRLGPDEAAGGALIAAAASRLILAMVAPGSAFGGRLAATASVRNPAHQASGMVAVQLDVAPDVALDALRAYAWLHDRSLDDVAAEVIARRLRFGP
jgi:hypothetical protein